MTVAGFFATVLGEAFAVIMISAFLAVGSWVAHLTWDLRRVQGKVARGFAQVAEVFQPRADKMVTERLDNKQTTAWEGAVTHQVHDELVLVSKTGTRITAHPGSIGRDPRGALVLGEKVVSRKHATFTFRSGRWAVVDHESTNGTFVNGHRVPTSGDGIVFSDGDTVMFGRGGPSFRVRLNAADVTARA